MWRFAELPVSFCASCVMVFGCVLASCCTSRSRLYSPSYTEMKRATPRITPARYDKYDGFGNLRSLQVTGIAAMVEPFSEEYNAHAAFKKIPLDALKKLPSPMNLICVTPTRIDALFSDFKKDGYSVRQVLHQLA